ncbi:MAG: 50S ribosomal protein P1 [Thermococcus sp.]|uniref:Large ribosomal subunit protein P1 n=1 Tax=Thermococcus guaymasensis DSM 11113 TaxID=1432656 RepID=A0A0X1KKM4_9EURY|nr:50S ribosomal protein P1 [Thermococcus guaymasensis]AJC71831.1 50S ribosomal protein L12 [Thermococcus guaymasensis DSM 11113]MCD6525115.1 50S ribosomal protein P1 [Thermococcus sp.]
MEYVYAALLLHAAGKEITEENLKKVLEAAGVSPDEARIKALVAALEGVNIDEVIEKAAMPVAAPVAVAAAPAPAEGGVEQAQEEEEEEEEEVSEEEALAGLGALFG